MEITPSFGSDPPSSALLDALTLSQRLGMLGRRPIAEVFAQATAVVAALATVLDAAPAERPDARPVAPPGDRRQRHLLVDLGSGGGTPGLVVAWYRPDDEVVLIERRATRADHLMRLVRRLELHNAVVFAGDADGAAQQLDRPAAAATARGFGPPRRLLRLATPLLAPTGAIVVTEPPEPAVGALAAARPADGWRDLDAAELEAAGFRRRASPDPRVAVLQRHR